MTRTEKLELLLTMSQRVDSYKSQLRLNKKMYNEGARLGLSISTNIYNIEKYRKAIGIIEIRFNRLNRLINDK